MKTTYQNQTTELVNPATLEPNEVFCVDGTKDITNGKMPPCTNNGGVKSTLSVKPTSESVKQLNLLVGGNTLTAEDKFYESLGIKKSSGGWGIQSRPIGRILVAVVLVAGYFAYKKYKK